MNYRSAFVETVLTCISHTGIWHHGELLYSWHLSCADLVCSDRLECKDQHIRFIRAVISKRDAMSQLTWASRNAVFDTTFAHPSGWRKITNYRYGRD